jgi:flagellar motor switch protein FliN/FliY
MATNQAIGVVSAAKGEVFARSADGKMRRLAVGDQVFEGDVIVTAAGSSAGGGMSHPPPPSMELLLDVEMPVSVSFGRTNLLLKEVIKLSTGSIIELNRTITEPVEVIVNNCVIARGEVVVIEGNYGVRIQQIVSRSERLKSVD